MSEENSQIFSNLDFKEQLYVFYLEIKGELTKKNIEIEKSKLQEIANSTNPSTILNYIRELFYMIKEKVKYEGGKFLNNERKDNEIIILRQENSILKKEIKKYKENNDLYESKIKSEQETITELKKQISSLSKKVTKIEKENINIKQPNNHNSSINININNNGNSSSKWIIKQENQEISNNTNNSNSLIPNMNPGSSFALKKRRINNFTKNYRKFNSNLGQTTTNNYNLQLRSKLNLYEKRINNGSQNKMHKSHSRAANHQENNNAFTATYNKILNNLFIKNKTPNKRDKNYKKKKISSTINIDDYDRTIINNINKSRKFKSNAKNNSYNKIIGIIPNSRFPLSSKHQGNKNMSSSIPKKNLVREKSNVSHSSLIINKK